MADEVSELEIPDGQTLSDDQTLEKQILEIAPLEENLLAEARAHLDTLTKPVGSLGRLEEMAAQLFAIHRGRLGPCNRAVYIFAADHGIVAEGVSAYPSEVTHQMVRNFLSGGAAINVLAKLNGIEVKVIDAGVDADMSAEPGLLHAKVRRGSRNMLREPAMSEEELRRAMAVGFALALKASEQGRNLIAIGEMGIGNTTAASAITAALTGLEAAVVTGRGTGLDSAGHARKCQIVAALVTKHCQRPSQGHPGPADAREILRCLGGLEIAAMTGMMLGAARRRIPVVIDGFISTAAAAVACSLAPATLGYLFAGHQSEEPGHKILLAHLGLQPILSLQMRLGEGTGAVLAMPILEAAIRLYLEMATFTSAGVSGASR